MLFATGLLTAYLAVGAWLGLALAWLTDRDPEDPNRDRLAAAYGDAWMAVVVARMMFAWPVAVARTFKGD